MKRRADDGHLRTKRWKEVRLQVLDRDGYRCVCCGKAGRLEVDHRRPVWLGGSKFDLANLQTLARGCHIQKTRREFQQREAAKNPGRAAWRSLIEELKNDEAAKATA